MIRSHVEQMHDDRHDAGIHAEADHADERKSEERFALVALAWSQRRTQRMDCPR